MRTKQEDDKFLAEIGYPPLSTEDFSRIEALSARRKLLTDNGGLQSAECENCLFELESIYRAHYAKHNLHKSHENAARLATLPKPLKEVSEQPKISAPPAAQPPPPAASTSIRATAAVPPVTAQPPGASGAEHNTFISPRGIQHSKFVCGRRNEVAPAAPPKTTAAAAAQRRVPRSKRTIIGFFAPGELLVKQASAKPVHHRPT